MLLNAGPESVERTAAKAFEDWPDAKARLSCQDYTFLYVAMARSVHLDAYYVRVNRDCRGNVVLHSCAGVFTDKGALLIDPSYVWFGAPHQDYQFEDDLGALVFFLAQSRDLKSQILALRLAPDSAFAHFELALNLAGAGKLKPARDQLRAGLASDSTSWLALFTQGVVESYENDLQSALDHLQRSRDMSKACSAVHYFLGSVLAATGRLPDARDELYAYLRGHSDRELVDDAQKRLAEIEALLAGEGHPQTADAQSRENVPLPPHRDCLSTDLREVLTCSARPQRPAVARGSGGAIPPSPTSLGRNAQPHGAGCLVILVLVLLLASSGCEYFRPGPYDERTTNWRGIDNWEESRDLGIPPQE